MAEALDRPATKKKVKVVEEVEVPLIDAEGTKAEKLQVLFNKWWGCTKCPLGEERCKKFTPETRDAIVFGDGNPEADVLIVGEAPGEEEEETALPFYGRSGMLLNQILAMTSADPAVRQAFEEFSAGPRVGTKGEVFINAFRNYIVEWRRKEFFITNTVACRPPENRTPTPGEVKTCWERLWNIIYIVDPIIIIAAGSSALGALIGKTQFKISQERGKIITVEHQGRVVPFRYDIVPIYHPAYLIRKADWDSPNGDFRKTVEDVRTALNIADFKRWAYKGTPIPKRRD